MTASPLELGGMLLACGGAAAALLARDPRLRYGAAAVALAAAPALVAGDVWHSERFIDLRHDPAKLAAVIVVWVAAVGGGAAAFYRVPWAFPISAFAALPLRIPVQLGGETSHLLLPLYVVIAAGIVCFGYRALARANGNATNNPAPAEGGAAGGEPPLVTWLYRALAATLVVYAIQTAYSAHVSNAIENAAFFLVPFAVMFVLLTEVSWTPRLLGGVLAAVAGLGLVLAAVAFWEYAARDLLLSRGDLLQSNQLHLYFRVNSLFYDPNVFGRYLALILVALGAFLAWARDGRAAVVAAAVAGVLLGALALSYSLTSMAALVVGLLVVAALRWSLRWALAGGAAILVCGAVFLLVSGTGESDLGSAKDFDATTSGRVGLVRGGLELAEDRPIWGWGSGSFGAAFSRHIERARTTVSHSEPITVAAEQGAIGLIVYVVLVALALVVLLSGAGGSAGTAAVAAGFVAMLVHSLSYAGFAIDPATWALLGLGVALRRTRPVPAAAAVGDDRGALHLRDRRPAAV
jgi:O-antigen ligase/polysaccharide polymerase Wzy-like membrane protein